MKRPLTDAEKLIEIEALIEDFRYARNDPILQEHRTYLTLKSIAADLRGRGPGVAGAAQVELQRVIDNAIAAKTGLGYDVNRLRRVAEELIGRWPTIRQALERFDRVTRDQQEVKETARG